MADRLAQAFIDAVDEAQRAGFAAIADLSAQLASALERGRAAWPTVVLDDADVVTYLARRVPERGDADDDVFAGLRVEDMYLACGCTRGVTAAIAAFDTTFAADLAATAKRFHALPGEDVSQQVRAKILVGSDGRPKIADYAGLGFLQNWVRITAVRTYLDASRKQKSNKEIPYSEGLMAVADPDDDVELAYLKRHYRDEFKRAFSEAITTLTSQQRNALRQNLIAGLTIDQIAAVYGIHRATAARRIANAREALLAATRRLLAARLRIDRTELASIMRLIHSQLDVSFVRLLQSKSRG